MIGNEDLVKSFKRISADKSLYHSYIFFGDPQIGKFTFAKELANFLENNKFETPNSFLNEVMEITPDENGNIGIDRIRDLKQFLFQRPIRSDKRVVIINDADTTTSQAQNAILKIAEEPPTSALIILIVSNSDSLIATLQSRFAKIYFKRVEERKIKKFLMDDFEVTEELAKSIAKISFGRPGRALDLFKNEEIINLNKNVKAFIKNKAGRSTYIKSLEDGRQINTFMNELIAELSRDFSKTGLY